MPEEICINKGKCDLNFYILNSDETECGLCSYFYQTGNKFKLVYSIGCISTIPNNTEYYNEKYYLLKCKTNYHPDKNECLPDYCYERCDTCTDLSNDINDQKCLTCKEGFVLFGNNCQKSLKTILEPTTIIKAIDSTSPNKISFPKDNGYQNCSNLIKINEEINYSYENKYVFYGYYKGINKKIGILKSFNISNIDEEILKEIRFKMTKGEINSSYLENGNYFIVESPDARFIISKLEEKEELITIVDLGLCEDKLRENMNLLKINSLYILYVELNEDGMAVPRTEFELYYKTKKNDFKYLDLHICKDMVINKYISINISKFDIDKYNSISGFYNDICYTYT